MWHSRKEGRADLNDEKARCTLCPEVESKRVGRTKGDDKKRGPKEMKRSALLNIPTAGIFPSRFQVGFQGKKSIFDGPFFSSWNLLFEVKLII